VITLERKGEHEARDKAFEQVVFRFIRVTRIIPVCCNHAMKRYSGGGGTRLVYYKCDACGNRANGTTTREKF
jgi:hypothetical protein